MRHRTPNRRHLLPDTSFSCAQPRRNTVSVTLDQISSQCFARTNKVLLSTPLERIHTSTQLPDLNGASTRCLSADRTQLHKC